MTNPADFADEAIGPKIQRQEGDLLRRARPVMPGRYGTGEGGILSLTIARSCVLAMVPQCWRFHILTRVHA